MSQPTPVLAPRPTNTALWTGFLIVVLGIVSNFFVFWHFPGEATWPYVTLLLQAIGVVLLIVGLKRAFGQPQIFRGKIFGSIVTVFSVLLLGLAIFGHIHARDIPASAGAPKVGQKAPAFTLVNTTGQSVSLSQLLSTPVGGRAPKAVLLIFYRGWW